VLHESYDHAAQLVKRKNVASSRAANLKFRFIESAMPIGQVAPLHNAAPRRLNRAHNGS
jgi:hypothetical protein